MLIDFNWAYNSTGLSSSSFRSFSVEYDSILTPRCNDADSNHIGLNLNWTCNSATSNEVTPQLDSGNDLWSWIDYDSGSTYLSVYLSDNNSKPSGPKISVPIDLCYLRYNVTSYFYPGFAGAGNGEVPQTIEFWY